MTSTKIDIVDVTKAYGDTTVISNLSATIEPGEFYTLLGPSGCGKTTLLRMIAGFNTIEGGDIFFSGTRINDADPAKRRIGMVFQDYAIFPHLTAQKNVEFGLRNMDHPKATIGSTAREFLELVQMGQWADRRPENLSGGQQQRVALARALVTSPRVLLMDEPLSNLDAKLRVEMRDAIRELQHRVGITTVYVTHDQEEAMAVSDRIAVMKDGIIQQVGPPEELYARPANTFVATFVGTNNILPAAVGADRSISVLGTSFPLPASLGPISAGKVQLSVRPEHLVVNPESGPSIGGTVRTRTFLGRDTHYTIEVAADVTVDVVRRSEFGERIAPGSGVTLGLMTQHLNIFSADGATNLQQRDADGGRSTDDDH